MTAACLLCFMLGHFLATKQSRSAIKELNAALTRAQEDTILMSETAEHCSAQWQEWEIKAESFRSFNSSVLTERDKWQALYFDQSHQHGNAQVWMMEAIDHLTRRMEALGQKVQIPPVLAELQASFAEKHLKQSETAQVTHRGVDNLGTDTASASTASAAPSPEKS